MRIPPLFSTGRINVVAAATALATILTFAVAATLTGIVAHAQTNPIGTLTFSDPVTGSNIAQGTDLSAPTVTTSGPCPEAANAFHVRLQGPGDLDNLAVGRTTAGFSATDPVSVPFGNTFKDIAALDTPPKDIVPGTYTVSLNCVSGLVGSTIEASYVATVEFTTPTSFTVSNAPSGTPTPTPPVATPTPMPTPPVATPTPMPTPPVATPTPTPTPGARETTVELRVFPRPAFVGLPVIFIANVSPFDANGTIQLKDGDTNLGGPVPVFGGFAFGITTLPNGTHSLTAAFTPADPADFTPSTSPPVSLDVRTLFSFFLSF